MSKKLPNLFYFTPKSGFPEWETKKAVEWLLKNEGEKCWSDMGRETGVRSLNQNSALHVGFGLIAEELNAAGLDMKKVLKPEVDIPWTVESVKEYLYKPVMKAMTGKVHTSEMDKNEPGEVWEVLLKHLAEKHHVEFIEFPSEATKNK